MTINRVGPPVRSDDFYGREKFVDLVWRKLEVGHVLLAAPRRFGKTSVMYALIDVPRDNCKVIHADLEHLIEPADLLVALIEKLAKDDRFSKVVNNITYFPRTLWERFKNNFVEVDLWKVKVTLREALRDNWQEKGEELFKLISSAQETQRIIFILDEFPMMIDRMARSEAHREEAKTLLRWLRRLRQSPETGNVRFMIAGSIGIGHVLNDLGEIASINDFESLRLEPFAPKIATAFLDLLADSHQVPLTPATKRRMLKVIGTHVPYFIQIIFSEVAKTYAQDGETVTPKKVDVIYRDKVLGVDCKTYFDHYYGRLRDYYTRDEEKAVKRILRELARGALKREACLQLCRQELNGFEIESFNRLMSDLENDFYVVFDADAEHYEFASKLLSDWWLRHYGMEAA